MTQKYGSDTASPSKNEERERKAIIKQARSFRSVFGKEGNRTDEQRHVLALIREWGWMDMPFSSAGGVSTEQVLVMEGKRELALCLIKGANYDLESQEKEAPVVDTSSQVGK